MLTSRDNRWLRDFRAALAGKAEGISGVEGPRIVEEALRSTIRVDAVLVSESGRRHLDRISGLVANETRLLATSDSLFENVAGTETPQGIAAVVRPAPASFDDLLSGPQAPLVVVLVGVQDPGNVGTVIRTAEALGGSGIATCRAGNIGSAHPFSPKVLRASAGSAFRLPILDGVSTAVLQTQLRVMNITLFAAVSDGEIAGMKARAAWEADFRGASAIFIGNEGAGLPTDVALAADVSVRIPLAEARRAGGRHVESLNAATAASILLYEASRQRARASTEFSTATHGINTKNTASAKT